MDQQNLVSLLPHVAVQLRHALSNLYMASTALAPAEKREQDEELDRRAARMDQSFYQILRLVNQLSAAIYLTHEEPLPQQGCDVGEVMEDLCAAAKSLAYFRGVEFSFRNEVGHHTCALAVDATEQIVYNLLSNAFKFTPAGGRVDVVLEKKGKNLLLTVSDTGCGMTAEELERLFDAYRHGDVCRPRPYGVGLGLALCRRFARGQGGNLLATSVPGQGSSFTLSLPDRPAESLLRDVPVDYSGGFSRSLLGLADALPAEAFRIREQD